jgi:hypothetical protein
MNKPSNTIRVYYDEIKELQRLVPKNIKLPHCGGNNWNNTPADCNASGFYEYPKGTVFLGGELGGELKIIDKI